VIVNVVEVLPKQHNQPDISVSPPPFVNMWRDC